MYKKILVLAGIHLLALNIEAAQNLDQGQTPQVRTPQGGTPLDPRAVLRRLRETRVAELAEIRRKDAAAAFFEACWAAVIADDAAAAASADPGAAAERAAAEEAARNATAERVAASVVAAGAAAGYLYSAATGLPVDPGSASAAASAAAPVSFLAANRSLIEDMAILTGYLSAIQDAHDGNSVRDAKAKFDTLLRDLRGRANTEGKEALDLMASEADAAVAAKTPSEDRPKAAEAPTLLERLRGWLVSRGTATPAPQAALVAASNPSDGEPKNSITLYGLLNLTGLTAQQSPAMFGVPRAVFHTGLRILCPLDPTKKDDAHKALNRIVYKLLRNNIGGPAFDLLAQADEITDQVFSDRIVAFMCNKILDNPIIDFLVPDVKAFRNFMRSALVQNLLPKTHSGQNNGASNAKIIPPFIKQWLLSGLSAVTKDYADFTLAYFAADPAQGDFGGMVQELAGKLAEYIEVNYPADFAGVDMATNGPGIGLLLNRARVLRGPELEEELRPSVPARAASYLANYLSPSLANLRVYLLNCVRSSGENVFGVIGGVPFERIPDTVKGELWTIVDLRSIINLLNPLMVGDAAVAQTPPPAAASAAQLAIAEEVPMSRFTGAARALGTVANALQGPNVLSFVRRALNGDLYIIRVPRKLINMVRAGMTMAEPMGCRLVVSTGILVAELLTQLAPTTHAALVGGSYAGMGASMWLRELGMPSIDPLYGALIGGGVSATGSYLMSNPYAATISSVAVGMLGGAFMDYYHMRYQNNAPQPLNWSQRLLEPFNGVLAHDDTPPSFDWRRSRAVIGTVVGAAVPTMTWLSYNGVPDLAIGLPMGAAFVLGMGNFEGARTLVVDVPVGLWRAFTESRFARAAWQFLEEYAAHREKYGLQI